MSRILLHRRIDEHLVAIRPLAHNAVARGRKKRGRDARAEREIAAREEYVRLLGVAPGERVLDVGCGSGARLRRKHPASVKF